MAYQPIVRASDGALFGYEALLRSREPALPNPGAVLDAAERLGRLFDLGRKVRARAADAMVHAPERARLFVNLHARDLLDERLTSPDGALSAIASRVVLEITERAPLDHMQDARARVSKLRAMGFSIAVDDLGAGYAGLTSFTTLEPEFIKLDMSLVRGVDQNPKKQTLIRSIAALCKEMSVCCVAEGIETIQERDAIIGLGCDLLQGYVLAKPGPAFPDYVW
jgi:EAL domain-containing protein (putative c-di-GMP-specific phosphodiesterase class I)